MDRKMIYPGQIPLETDLLDTNRFALIGLGKLAAAVLGTTTIVNGLACTPTAPASMQVQVAPGEIYSLQNLDGTAYSSLAADTAHQILKQGLLMDAVTLSCPAPTTVGQSINYLVQATYQDTDTDAVVLPYYNASNPAQAYTGPNNSGTAQNTVRKGVCAVAVKAGIAATTGSQTTPAPDSGYVGLFVVTVAYGQTTIVAGDITTASGAPILSETLLQKISVATGDARYALLSSQGANAQTQPYTAFTTTGATGAFVLTPSPALTAYAANQRFRVKFHTAGNGSDTMNVSGLGAKSLKQYDFTGSKVAAAIAANQLVDVEYDGADFVLLNPYPQAAGISFRGSRSVATTSSLALTDIGGCIELSSPDITVTLPPVASSPYGGAIAFRANYDCSLKGNATETISASLQSPVNTFPVFAGDALTLVNVGPSWHVMNAGFGTAAFARSKTVNGYQKLPGGLIFQWMLGIAGGSSSSVSNSFPIAFPTACVMATGTHIGRDASVSVVTDSGNISATEVGMKSNYTGGPVSCLIFAIGY